MWGGVGGASEGGAPKEREKATKCSSQIKCFSPLQAVQMGGLITRHMNLHINLPLAL